MSTSVRFKSKVALPFLIAVVSLGYPHAQTKVLRLVPVQSSSTKINSGTIVETKMTRPSRHGPCNVISLARSEKRVL